MVRPDSRNIEGWGDDFSDDDFGRYPEAVDIPDVVKEVYAEQDKVLYMAVGGIALTILTGYGVKRLLKKRKS